MNDESQVCVALFMIFWVDEHNQLEKGRKDANVDFVVFNGCGT